MIQKILLSSKSWAPIRKPMEILCPTDWYPCTDENQQRMTEEFLVTLETHLGTKCRPLSLTKLWSQTAPIDFREPNLADFLQGLWVEQPLFNASDGATLRVMLVPHGRGGTNFRDGTPGA
ncbi:hypothetical protein N7493_009976 [Penicillium malachiteum]|uniref:Uncharacterized protein n=1 Tax=Penicillium malachiteum TaxID=1324776 RepID=A0AAD6MS23_9EURO|nr:hypothetical protein N7493_009976 [Penicillium malachiteum]